jgi:N-acetylmuramoyl-L-alanine amidase
MRHIAGPFVLPLVVLTFAPALAAAPRYARIVVGTREAVLSPRPVVEGGAVYAPVGLLKALGADYVAGEGKVRVVMDEGAAELGVVQRQGSPMICVSDAARFLGAEYLWDDATSTVRLLAKLVSVEFDDSTLTIRLTLPVRVSSSRLWANPWRISMDLPGTRLGTRTKTVSVGSSDISKIRLGQFTDDTARIVIDLDRKLDYRILTTGPGRAIKVRIGAGPAATVRPSEPAPKPGPAPKHEPPKPVTISAIGVEPDGDSKLTVRISTSGQPAFRSYTLSAPPRIVVDVQNATLTLPADDIPVQHPLLRGVRTGRQDGTARIVLDTARYAAFSSASEGNDVTVTLSLPVSAGGKLSEKTIVLDPGHGGDDPGAQAGGVKEKDLNLLIARRIKEALEEVGSTVIMTRDDDRAVDIYSRPVVANNSSADFFISIHCNALIPESETGIETYYHPGEPSSRALASSIHDRVIQRTGMKDRGARLDTKLYQAGLAVLRTANVPALLIEFGYIDCSADRTLLCDDAFRGKIARGVVEGLRNYVEGTAEPEGN